MLEKISPKNNTNLITNSQNLKEGLIPKQKKSSMLKAFNEIVKPNSARICCSIKGMWNLNQLEAQGSQMCALLLTKGLNPRQGGIQLNLHWHLQLC